MIERLSPRALLSGNANAGFGVDGVPLEDIAERFGTPCYVYSEALLRASFQAFQAGFKTLKPTLCFAVKANSNLAILNRLHRLGAGFDIVSGGELARVIAAGGDPNRVVFSGVGKSVQEIEFALRQGVMAFNVESAAELTRIHSIAERLHTKAPVSLRVNPDVDAKTHPYIATGLRDSKFGVAWESAVELYETAAMLPGIQITGVDCHIGSQITELGPFEEAIARMAELLLALNQRGIQLQHIDLGGGLGIQYRDEVPIELEAYAAAIERHLGDRTEHLILEPGRRIIGNAGLLLTRVEYLKTAGERTFALIDAAMNDLMRPALYEAWHEAVVVRDANQVLTVDLAGPVCESGDILARERRLALEAGSLVALLSAGAYGSSMSSHYNTRPRAAEVLIENGEAKLIRARESLEALWAEERVPE